MSGYALHPEAFADLDDIREYIAEDNPDAADRVITEIFDGIRRLVAARGAAWAHHPRHPPRTVSFDSSGVAPFDGQTSSKRAKSRFDAGKTVLL